MQISGHQFRRRRRFAGIIPAVLAVISIMVTHHLRALPGDYFESSIRPVLIEHCSECHGIASGKSKGGLSLDTVAGITRGGDSGAVIVPGDPDNSRLFQLISHREPDERMPPDYRLKNSIISIIREWIADGAPMPEPAGDPSPARHEATSENARAYPQSWEEHWAFQATETESTPEPAGWGRNPIDAFVAEGLEDIGLSPSGRAGWPALLRRVYLDLTGMIPGRDEMESFLSAPSVDAYDRLVDDLLSRRSFGEHWARMWLDVARYADSNGSDENLYHANAWRYRNYVVDSFNQDKPFDEFLTEQLAGDLLVDQDSGGFQPERIIATGFLNLGPKLVAEQDKEKLLMDLVDEQLDVVGQAFMGLAIGCARCHDHKFDPFTQADYYAMAGIFRSTQSMGNLDFVSHWLEVPLESVKEREHRRLIREEIEKIDHELVRATNAAKDRLRKAVRAGAAESITEALAGKTRDGEPHGIPAVEAWARLFERIGNQSAAHWIPLLKKHGLYPVTTARLLEREDLHSRSVELTKSIEALLGNSSQNSLSAEGAHLSSLKSGKDSALEIGHHKSLESVEMTASIWVRLSGDSRGEGDSRRWLLAKNPNEWADGHFSLGLQGRRPLAYLNIGGGKDMVHSLSGSRDLSEGQWHHLVLAVSREEARLYFDGDLEQKLALPRPRTFGSGVLAIGKRPDNYNFFEGLLDEAAIYNYAAGAESVQALFESRKADGLKEPPVWHESFNLPAEELEMLGKYQKIRTDLKADGGPFSLPEEPEKHFSEADRNKLSTLESRKAGLQSSIPPDPGTAMCVKDSDELINLKLHVRGSHLSLKGDPLARRMPMAHLGLKDYPVPDDSSGRLQLAQWLTDPGHPLTARVIVNRLWQNCFGKGIVSTPNNFGRRGDQPSHPELLDWLAGSLIENQWSLKHIIRLIVTSSTYMQASRPEPKAIRIDPDNRTLWRMSPRRMTVEQIRDSLLKATGDLAPAPETGPADVKNFNYVPGGDFFRKIFESSQRTVYLPIIRDRVHPDLEIFDFANPGVSSGRRPTTTVPLQALYFLNNPRIHQWAEKLATHAFREPEPVQFLYRVLLSREPHISELEVFAGLENDPAALKEVALVLLGSNEFVYRL